MTAPFYLELVLLHTGPETRVGILALVYIHCRMVNEVAVPLL